MIETGESADQVVTSDIVVIGAGAAGLTAAIFAAEGSTSPTVVALDGAPKIGAKILISGGGRCNVTHDLVGADDFNSSRNAVARVLRTFTVEQTVAWFASMGVELKREEGGKLFPTTDRARTVIDALVKNCQAQIRTHQRVLEISRTDVGFAVRTSRGVISARRVILATGGKSVPKTGSDGQGYELARALGHTTGVTFPALVPLVVKHGFWTSELMGASVMAELAVRSASGRVLRRERGSLLLTHFGLSGPVALDISRHWLAARQESGSARLTISFLPDATFESLEAELMEAARRNPRSTVGSVLRGRMPERILERLAPGEMLGALTREVRRSAIHSLLECEIPIERDRGFDFAEVTAGGVPLAEVDPATMASRVCPGLYLCGEILDVDGRIGGYNFQWAWASGRLAGLSAAKG